MKPRKASALDETGPDDYNYVKRMLETAIKVDFPHQDAGLDEVDWMIQRAVQNWDPSHIICILLMAFKTAAIESGNVEGVLHVMEVFGDPSSTDASTNPKEGLPM